MSKLSRELDKILDNTMWSDKILKQCIGYADAPQTKALESYLHGSYTVEDWWTLQELAIQIHLTDQGAAA